MTSRIERPGQFDTPFQQNDQAKQEGQSTLAQARETVGDVASTVQDTATQAVRQVSQTTVDLKTYAQENPWLVIGAGLAAGYLLSTLLKGQRQEEYRYYAPQHTNQPYVSYGQQSQGAAMQQAQQYESTQREGMVGKLGRTFFGSLNSLDDLFQEQLQDLYDAEHQILKALPQMIQAASAPELKQAFERHLQQTQGQVRRLEQVFGVIGAPPKGKACAAMQGLLAEGQELMAMRADPAVMDAGLIASAQRVEHYEIAGYGCLRTWARQLGHQQAVTLLEQTLHEEEQTDKQLSQIAERAVNLQASAR